MAGSTTMVVVAAKDGKMRVTSNSFGARNIGLVATVSVRALKVEGASLAGSSTMRDQAPAHPHELEVTVGRDQHVDRGGRGNVVVRLR